MLKEIGSNFWIDTKELQTQYHKNNLSMSDFGISGQDSVFLSTGRAAIRYALQDIKKEKRENELTALIPPYTCETVLQPFLSEDIEVYAYNINDDLEIEANSFWHLLESTHPDIVLIHRYFGFDNAKSIKEIEKNYQDKKCIFIEDRTQNLFSSFDSLSVDYIVGSFRKWDAIPDGGFCVKVKKSFGDFDDVLHEDSDLISQKLQAFQLKKEYMVDGKGEKELILDYYRKAEDVLDNEEGFFRMSDISKQILSNLDTTQIIEKRRNNYAYIYEHLDNDQVVCITGELEYDVVPLYITVRAKRRDNLQLKLREQDIYAPIVWPKPDEMPEVSATVNSIYREALCLPIDQRYGIDDMERMINIVNSFK